MVAFDANCLVGQNGADSTHRGTGEHSVTRLDSTKVERQFK